MRRTLSVATLAILAVALLAGSICCQCHRETGWSLWLAVGGWASAGVAMMLAVPGEREETRP